MNKINIIVADDHQLFRDGLTSLLNKHPFLNVLTNVEDGIALFDALKTLKTLPDIILLDLSMPNMNGFEALKILSKKYKKIKAIAISMHDDGNYIARCAQYGAHGYLLKNTDEDEVLNAIKQVHNGAKYYNQELSKKMIDSMAEVNSIKKLTKKESEILELLAQGLTTKEIATKFYISTRTVETHRSNMLKKLEVKNTVELINKASSLNII
ncbi:response regulator transcription factor [Wenyingzhuangia sp. 2_MG-2023]|uniref:response regulator n=1 Tax=Wenyingzhuangia sp. 2_MG-2023 TaxID=3062639 RepID=UPI0026E1753A|nr:response regulator transcription factor [Wenyingzhuangia sp. 2_MG-2023]MDO6738030.1 response regulator transcription factor [Wenyingzhuangia sp. 2_MG-2023]MDO6802616.1 response regulator transcription factor [Wenyingzhuangia sp. 1_MG-2023]